MSAEKCYRCGGPLVKHHERTEWAFLGAFIRAVTETATPVTRLVVRATSIKYGPRRAEPNVMTSDDVALCFTCYGAVMAFIGVGKRPENRMPKEATR